jgi:hypothetical protein
LEDLGAEVERAGHVKAALPLAALELQQHLACINAPDRARTS